MYLLAQDWGLGGKNKGFCQIEKFGICIAEGKDFTHGRFAWRHSEISSEIAQTPCPRSGCSRRQTTPISLHTRNFQLLPW